VGADVAFWDGRITLGATYFDQTLEDEIFSASRAGATALARADCPVPPVGATTSCNRAFDSKQRGVELFGHVEIVQGLTLSGSYTDLDADENGVEEIRRASRIGSANLTWRPLDGRATLNLNVRHNGPQLDSNFTGIPTPFPAGLPDVKPGTGVNAGRVVLASYTLANLSGSFEVTEAIEVFGRVENLADEDYYEVFGFPTSPRAAYVGARLWF
jgi:vitamin B12 transporter